MATEPLKVATALGIGDSMWAVLKFRALSHHHDGRPIHAFVNESPNHATVGFLEICAPVAQASRSDRAPFDVWKDMPPNHRFPRWSSLKGCAGWREFDYVAVPNGHLEKGLALETWWPELGPDATEWTFDLNIKPEDWQHADQLMGEKPDRVLLYLSGIGPNEGFHCHRWRAKDWAEVVLLLNAEGLEPLLVGANTKDDLGYRDWVLKALDGAGKLESAVGMTTIPQYCALIELASCWVGLNSGGGIVSAMRGTPTVMFWSDDRHPIHGVHPRNTLHHGMQENYLAPWRRNGGDQSHRPIPMGSDDLTPRNVVAQTLEAMKHRT